MAGADDSLALLAWWRGLTNAMFADESPRHPVFVALKPTAEEFDLTPEPFLDLVSAFEQDQTVAAYETFADLRDYCRRSADPVGRIVLRLLGAYEEENVRLSDSVCTGLQLVNFWQDVSRDADIGRRYLPTEDMRRFGYPLDDFAARRSTPAFLDLMRFQVDRAEKLLLAGRPLADRLGGAVRGGGGPVCLRGTRGLPKAAGDRLPRVGQPADDRQAGRGGAAGRGDRTGGCAAR